MTEAQRRNMNEFRLNQMTGDVPLPLHLMDEEERRTLPVAGDAEWIGLSAPEIHMIVTAGWKHLGGFVGTVLSAHDIAKETEKNIRRALAASGYEAEGFKAYQVRAPKAEGFRYTYTVQGTAMTAETCIVKTGRDLYELHFYSRTETLDECLPVWEELLASLRWQN